MTEIVVIARLVPDLVEELEIAGSESARVDEPLLVAGGQAAHEALSYKAWAKARPSPRAGPMDPMPMVRPAAIMDIIPTRPTLSI